jgi:hypothetical protein
VTLKWPLSSSEAISSFSFLPPRRLEFDRAAEAIAFGEAPKQRSRSNADDDGVVIKRRAEGSTEGEQHGHTSR